MKNPILSRNFFPPTKNPLYGGNPSIQTGLTDHLPTRNFSSVHPVLIRFARSDADPFLYQGGGDNLFRNHQETGAPLFFIQRWEHGTKAIVFPNGFPLQAKPIQCAPSGLSRSSGQSCKICRNNHSRGGGIKFYPSAGAGICVSSQQVRHGKGISSPT